MYSKVKKFLNIEGLIIFQDQQCLLKPLMRSPLKIKKLSQNNLPNLPSDWPFKTSNRVSLT